MMGETLGSLKIMAKRFGRNQKRKLQQQVVETAAKLSVVEEQKAELALESERRLRSQAWEINQRKRNQVLIDLSLDQDMMSRDIGIRLTAVGSDHRFSPVASFNQIDVRYQMSRAEEEDFVCQVGEMVARQLFEFMRKDWNLGYGRDRNPYERGNRHW